jgi:putative ABC transport system permease protein
VLGILVALAGVAVMVRVFPEFPVNIPMWAFLSALGVAVGTGMVFGLLPARRAAALDPVAALARR